MEQGCMVADEGWMYCRRAAVMSPEIVEIEDSKSFKTGTNNNNISICREDVYVGVGKDDLDVVKWVIEQYGSASCRVFLIHVFPLITHVPTPVGMLLRSQMAQDQVRFYSNQENNKRRDLLQKYIRLCQDAKVTVDTILIERNNTAKAILDLVPVLNITRLVLGTKRSPPSRYNHRPSTMQMLKHKWAKRSIGKGEYVKKNAPEYCEVSLMFEGKNGKQQDRTVVAHSPISLTRKWPQLEIHFLGCVCFSHKLD